MKNSRFLTQLLNEVKDRLSPDDVTEIIEFIENNEFGLAFEMLCTQLYEEDIQISCEFYKKISACGKSIKIQPFIWISLKELVTETA